MEQEKIFKKIKVLREEIHNLIEEKENLQDDEVIKKSEELDDLLNCYKNLLDNQ